jgi:hypothetical protein
MILFIGVIAWMRSIIFGVAAAVVIALQMTSYPSGRSKPSGSTTGYVPRRTIMLVVLPAILVLVVMAYAIVLRLRHLQNLHEPVISPPP